MGGLYRNIGAPHPRRQSVPVFRAGAWTFDTSVLRGDVFEPTPVEVARFRHKLREVERRAYPPMPGSKAQAEPLPAPEPEKLDPIDLELYRVAGTDTYELPNGRILTKAEAEMALGVSGGPHD